MTASIVDSILQWWLLIVLALIPVALLVNGIEALQRWTGKRPRRPSSADREAMMMRRTRDEVRRRG